MIKLSPARIFLSDNRRLQQSDVHRSFSTFNFGAHENTRKFKFSTLYVLNDEELAGAGSIKSEIKEDTYMLLLPVTGDLDFTGPANEQIRVNVGELKIISLPKKSSVLFSNPFNEDIINYLQICIKAHKNLDLSGLYNFDLDKNDNRLIPLCSPITTFSISIGRFSGRSEGIYKLRNIHSNLFIFVIAGAFEVEGRLLHIRDGLALSSVEEVDFEALSEGAILLVIELFDKE